MCTVIIFFNSGALISNSFTEYTKWTIDESKCQLRCPFSSDADQTYRDHLKKTHNRYDISVPLKKKRLRATRKPAEKKKKEALKKKTDEKKEKKKEAVAKKKAVPLTRRTLRKAEKHDSCSRWR